MDMLLRETKLFGATIFLLLCFSCKNKSTVSWDTERYKNYSKKEVGEYMYNSIYEAINDSMHIWGSNKIGNQSIWNFNYKLDSVLCFNKEKNKLISAFLVRCNQQNCLQDDVHFFYGIKMNGLWYFFKGPDITLPREYYQKDTHTPLSFEKLHELAMNNIFIGYLKKKDKGFFGNLFGKTEWEINDDFFSDLSSAAWCAHCKTQQQWDSTFLDVVKRNWETRDTVVGN
ncbi:hypothetical protein [Pinibacter aurantiacus]|uniref:Uncharacterized protein n=1 Tax=Pinibacter aurantiacus TaxID=2851599 RepID=A0A9E2S7C7_9BACT|nr:hypothetical protein [Pinibacter aurantiacus]MBV4357206.1 hypothetical protein [Pinibacter aurantiacus]